MQILSNSATRIFAYLFHGPEKAAQLVSASPTPALPRFHLYIVLNSFRFFCRIFYPFKILRLRHGHILQPSFHLRNPFERMAISVFVLDCARQIRFQTLVRVNFPEIAH